LDTPPISPPIQSNSSLLSHHSNNTDIIKVITIDPDGKLSSRMEYNSQKLARTVLTKHIYLLQVTFIYPTKQKWCPNRSFIQSTWNKYPTQAFIWQSHGDQTRFKQFGYWKTEYFWYCII
jgi:hypothetical protein